MSVATKNRIQNLFENRDRTKRVMSLFLTAGYPDLESGVELILGFEQSGADLIEIGIPFSDPLADGPTIQYSSTIAIRNGITMNKIFDMVEQVREKSDVPLILMGYINPILKYGVEVFCTRAAEAGVDGLIIPDVPPNESAIIQKPANDAGLSIVYLVAPNSSDERMKQVDELSEGFVYCVSVTGVTGVRDGNELATSVERFIDRVNRNVTQNPKMIGFGIRTHEDALRITKRADGFIVGSALIDAIRRNYPHQDWKEETFRFVKQLKYGNI